MAVNVAKPGKFLYFGFASNLLAERLRLKNPTAVYLCKGLLKNYRLGFGHSIGKDYDLWLGGGATVVPDTSSHIWGTVWQVDNVDLPHLDQQESIYHALHVDIETSEYGVLNCRCYQINNEFMKPPGLPSPYYLDVIVRGAIQHDLPADYIKSLKEIKHNGHPGPPNKCRVYCSVMESLNLDPNVGFTFLK